MNDNSEGIMTVIEPENRIQHQNIKFPRLLLRLISQKIVTLDKLCHAFFLLHVSPQILLNSQEPANTQN